MYVSGWGLCKGYCNTDAASTHSQLYIQHKPTLPMESTITAVGRLPRDIEIHFAHRQIQITATNPIPVHKYKWACAPFVGAGARLLQKLLQVLLVFILLTTCAGLAAGSNRRQVHAPSRCFWNFAFALNALLTPHSHTSSQAASTHMYRGQSQLL